jgi:hypothetical protein
VDRTVYFWQLTRITITKYNPAGDADTQNKKLMRDAQAGHDSNVTHMQQN